MLCLNLPPARAAHLPPLLAASVGSHPLVFMLGVTDGLRLLLAFWTLWGHKGLPLLLHRSTSILMLSSPSPSREDFGAGSPCTLINCCSGQLHWNTKTTFLALPLQPFSCSSCSVLKCRCVAYQSQSGGANSPWRSQLLIANNWGLADSCWELAASSEKS